MANAGAKFDNNVAPMSEAEAGAIDMAENPEAVAFDEPVNPQMDMGEPSRKQTEIEFDDTGAMIERSEPEMELSKDDPPASVLDEPPREAQPATHEDGGPEYMKALAESQQQMAEYMRLQQEYQYQQARQEEAQKAQQAQAYYSSAEYVTNLCENSGLDAEDPVHRQLIETRMDMYRQNQQYEQRMKHLEQQAQYQQYAQSHGRKLSALESSFNDAANQYNNVPEDIVSAARDQAKLLVDQGVTPEKAVAESIKFVRLSANQPQAARAQPAKARQARIDQLNSAGPGRGARSHKETGMTMAEADMLVSRGGFFPN